MTDSESSRKDVDAGTSQRMARQRRRDTRPELLLRSELHRKGLRYRVDASLPGMPRRRADVLFTRAKVAVFVDGCFWHGCPEHKTSPSNNGAWWAAKLTRNIERDRETNVHLTSLGWTVLRVWEHENMKHAATDIERRVRSNIAAAEPSTTDIAASATPVADEPGSAQERAVGGFRRSRRIGSGDD